MVLLCLVLITPLLQMWYGEPRAVPAGPRCQAGTAADGCPSPDSTGIPTAIACLQPSPNGFRSDCESTASAPPRRIEPATKAHPSSVTLRDHRRQWMTVS